MAAQTLLLGTPMFWGGVVVRTVVLASRVTLLVLTTCLFAYCFQVIGHPIQFEDEASLSSPVLEVFSPGAPSPSDIATPECKEDLDGLEGADIECDESVKYLRRRLTRFEKNIDVMKQLLERAKADWAHDKARVASLEAEIDRLRELQRGTTAEFARIYGVSSCATGKLRGFVNAFIWLCFSGCGLTGKHRSSPTMA